MANTGIYEVLYVSRQLKDFIMDQCKEEFLRHHPIMRGMTISQNLLLTSMARHYTGINFNNEPQPNPKRLE